MSGAEVVRSGLVSVRLREFAHDLGFELVGFAPIHESAHGEYYRWWLDTGRHGEMGYLAREDAVAARLDPRVAWPGVVSAVVVGMNYYLEDGVVGSDHGRVTDPAVPAADADMPDMVGMDRDPAGGGDRAQDHPDSIGIISRYARGRDYHKIIKRRLLQLLDWLEAEVGERLPLARAYVDTGPIFERELARRAGLGWQGQNAMLINPRRGSYFFLASLLVELELEYDEPFAENRCGSCSRCVTACPTGALEGWSADGAPLIDATRCISYLTIEQRGPIPRELRAGIGNRVFGCDICQEVCPWNSEKFVQLTREPGFAARGPGEPPVGVQPVGADSWGGVDLHPGTSAPSLVDLMATGLDEAAWDNFSRGSPIRRAGRAGFLRNVAIGLGNWLGSVPEPPEEAVAVLVRALEDPDPLVRGHAAWALGRVGSDEARRALEGRVTVEGDGFVREELAEALEN